MDGEYLPLLWVGSNSIDGQIWIFDPTENGIYLDPDFFKENEVRLFLCNFIDTNECRIHSLNRAEQREKLKTVRDKKLKKESIDLYLSWRTRQGFTYPIKEYYETCDKDWINDALPSSFRVEPVFYNDS